MYLQDSQRLPEIHEEIPGLLESVLLRSAELSAQRAEHSTANLYVKNMFFFLASTHIFFFLNGQPPKKRWGEASTVVIFLNHCIALHSIVLA